MNNNEEFRRNVFEFGVECCFKENSKSDLEILDLKRKEGIL